MADFKKAIFAHYGMHRRFIEITYHFFIDNFIR